MQYTINEIKDKTTPIAKAYGIGRMSLFGSYARGEAKENSDVDLYIDRGKLRSLLQYFAFVDELENALECHVDVVTTGIEDKEFLSAIMREGVLLYEE
ncbi:MAG: nucleotidyltransferase domain-containing protein [Bacteroidales bacterium]|nr:nucleotidyltransferase domain-containing protein [Bacteroidales bacterium]MCM1415780.1 nucleotidyltransferase domain-containing protein [bacterium]MCM1422726.1 nucleotidyltransferase domain-containing protein [bacterium]